jgi:hypothetical protein
MLFTVHLRTLSIASNGRMANERGTRKNVKARDKRLKKKEVKLSL